MTFDFESVINGNVFRNEATLSEHQELFLFRNLSRTACHKIIETGNDQKPSGLPNMNFKF